ncbi:MAG TPA: anthranilate synthase component I [Candidatus Sulfopaludibacter sp.]|nr:anthranilate synthase component I [Candidatus Sulfopaludibacter sp.]
MYSPTLEEFLRLAGQGNLIPVTRRLLADIETPLSAYRKIRGQAESFLFESVEGGEHLGRYSFVGCNPRAVIRQTGNRVEVVENGKVVESFEVKGRAGSPRSAAARSECAPYHVADGLEVVERVMKKFRPVTLPGLPRFTGGAVGFIGYEFIHDVEPVVPRPPKDESGTPTMVFLIADQLLIFDRVAQTITILVNAILNDTVNPADAYEEATSEIERLISLLEQPSEHHPVTVPDDVPVIPFESNQTKEKFSANVLKSKEYITAGDIIQVVGSQRFCAPVKASPLDIYRAVRSINPSPYMFLLELNGFSLVGASPEIHVRCEEGKVEIRPIAGTRRRGKNDEEDLALEKELLADPKERAEHVMLVDLARNDIGRVCDFGSVQVKELMVIERYSHVMHIVTQVEGKLSAGKTPYDLMRATFPAGTVSGAPKIRAMQIISELEQTARGPYAGCIGYFSFNGNLDTCITLRTALIKDGKAYVQAGGGWVNDSTPEGEYQETVNKSMAMRKAIAMAENFVKG